MPAFMQPNWLNERDKATPVHYKELDETNMKLQESVYEIKVLLSKQCHGSNYTANIICVMN